MAKMPDPTPEQVAAALRVSVGLLVRRLRQAPVPGELTLPETSALARLDRQGPTTAAALARVEQISPQSMGATLAGLEARGLVRRAPDREDRRRIILSLTDLGMEVLRSNRDARVRQMAQSLNSRFTADERAQLMALAPLLERLAQSI